MQCLVQRPLQINVLLTELDGVLQQPVALTRSPHSRVGWAPDFLIRRPHPMVGRGGNTNLPSWTGEGPVKTDTPESGTGILNFSQVSPAVSLLGANLSDNFPWLRYVPDRLRHRLTPTLAPGDFAPGPVLILLYAGRDDPLSLDSCIHAHYPRLSPHIVAFDTLRPPQALGQDLLADQPYAWLPLPSRD